jgi:hypothetical protein
MICYIVKGDYMRIDSSMPQPQRTSEMAVAPQRETAAEREPDGDADDVVKQTAKAAPAAQVSPQGVGTKVDIFA